MIRKTQAQVNIRRMVSTLKRFQFETKNDEHYLAKFQNEYYQKKRPSFKGLSFSKQSELPSLPVPELSVTLQKYLASIAPYCSTNDELEKQRKLCSDFAKEGTFLHERLLKYAENKRNWMSLFWDNQAYLEYNDPIIPYVSYFYGHRPLPCSHKAIEEDYLLKATAIICSVVKFIEVLKDESLPPEVFRGKPFCMNSFQLMFNNSRIPGDGRDSNVFYSIYENNFLTVVYKGNFYKVYTHNQDTLAPLPAGDIWRQLYAIVHKVSVGVKEETNVGIGILTTLPRDEWNSAYHELQTSPLSSSSLETIHRSSFILCLEVDKKPVTLEDKSRIYWHSDAVNRYNDKALQFIVCGNGASGFIAEHSKMDGTPTLYLNEYVNRELEGLDPQKFIASLGSFGATSTYTPEHLPFLLTPAIQQAIKQARVKFNDTIAEHDLSVWSYNKYGKDTIKSFGFSPDAYIQQIIQLGIYKYLGKQLPTYEAASTRGYFKGRTETGRSVTLASAKFLRFWQSPEVSNAQKVEALRESAKAHSAYLAMAANGQGIDRHFFGMKNMLREGDTIPDLFKDSLFRYSCTWLVSTSQLSSEYHDCYGWSQVNENGVGLAYMIKKNGLHINIVTKPEKSGYNVRELHYYFTEAANEMHALLSKNDHQDSKL